jgi:hypothetical protein
LSASAQMWASTHNDILEKQMSAVVSALSSCQEKMGSGYLSAFPSELFDRFEAIKPVWAPYYTIHKVGYTSNWIVVVFVWKVTWLTICALLSLTDPGRSFGPIYICR